MTGKVLTTLAGAVIGLVIGMIAGVIIGGGVDLITGHWFAWRWIFSGVSGLAAGLIAGAGTGSMGIRSRLGLEWLLLTFLAIPLGFMFTHDNWNWGNLLLLSGIGAMSGWLAGLVVRAVLRRRLTVGQVEYWVMAGHIVLFAALAYLAERLLYLLARILSY